MELEKDPPGFQIVRTPRVHLKYQYLEDCGERLNLRALSHRISGLDDATVARVWRLDCFRQPVTDAALDELQRFTNLESLALARTHVTDAGMHALARLPRLRWLTLNDCDITDIGLATIAVVDSLTELELYGTKVTGVGLKSLLRHPSLAVLDLRHTQVRDGLDLLITIPNLREVRLSWWAERRSDALRSARPEVVIV